jgi:hypothetical protein
MIVEANIVLSLILKSAEPDSNFFILVAPSLGYFLASLG